MNKIISIFKKISKLIQSPKGKFYDMYLIILAFGVGIVVYIINTMLIPQNSTAKLISSQIGAVFFCSLFGLAGLIVVMRRELQQVILIQGKLAVILGLFLCFFSWALALKYLILLIRAVFGFL